MSRANPLSRAPSSKGKVDRNDDTNWAQYDWAVERAKAWLGEVEEETSKTFSDAWERWELLEALIDGDAPRRFYVGEADDVDCQLSYRVQKLIGGRLKKDFFGQDDLVYMEPLRPDDAPYAEEAQAGLEQIARDGGIVEQGCEAIDDAVGLGPGILYHRFEERKTEDWAPAIRHRLEKDEHGIFSQKRSASKARRPREVVTEHIVTEALSPYDVAYPADARDPVNGEYLVLTFYWDEDEVQAMWDSGEWLNEELVKERGVPGNVRTEKEKNRGGYLGNRGAQNVQGRQSRMERFGHYIEPGEYRAGISKMVVKQCWCRYALRATVDATGSDQPEGADEHARPQECLHYFVNGIPVYMKPNPLVGDYRPVGIGQYERVNRLAIARGAVEPQASWHLFSNGILQQGMAAMLWETNPMVAYKESSRLEGQEFTPHPGLMLALEEPDRDMKVFDLNTNSAGRALSFYGAVREEGFSIPGATEVLRGETSSGARRSATEAQIDVQQAAARMWEPTNNIETGLIEKSFEIIHKLVMQFFSKKMLVKIRGTEATRFEYIYPDEAVAGFRVRSIGAVKMAAARGAAREMLGQTSVMISASQAGFLNEVNYREGFRRLFKMGGFPMVDTFIPREDSLLAMHPDAEHLRWASGVVPDVHEREEHSWHLERHNAYIRGETEMKDMPAFDDLPQHVRNEIMIHMEKTQAADAAQRQRDAHERRQRALAAIGGPGGGGPGGGLAGGLASPRDLRMMGAAGQRSGSRVSEAMPGQVAGAQDMGSEGARGIGR